MEKYEFQVKFLEIWNQHLAAFPILTILPFWHADVFWMNAEGFLERLQMLHRL